MVTISSPSTSTSLSLFYFSSSFGFRVLLPRTTDWQGEGEGIWRNKKKNSSDLERITSFTPSRRQTVSDSRNFRDCWAASREIQNPIPNIPVNLKKENRFNFNVLKLKNKSRFQSTSLEVRVKIRSKSSTNSLNVGRSMGLYCQHSRISKYLHSNRHTEKKKCEIGTNLLKIIKIKDLHFERAADWLLHAMAVAKELEESLNVGHRRIRRAAQGHNLPEEDAE